MKKLFKLNDFQSLSADGSILSWGTKEVLAGLARLATFFAHAVLVASFETMPLTLFRSFPGPALCAAAARSWWMPMARGLLHPAG